jgi:trans-2,3-dihydro-3-hydroxyanthranilate isomerase
MALLHYRLLNVFTRAAQRLSGNPLCVFEDGEGLATETMQAVARQFNLSETTFLLPATVRDAHARVRIFTPNYELAFAGHPTLGSASVCRSLGLAGDALKLEMSAGVIPVVAEEQRWTLTATLRDSREVSLGAGPLAEMLGLAASDIGQRPLWVSTGREQLVIPLTSTQAVQRAQARSALFESLASEDGQSMAYVFAHAGPEAILARFFFPQRGATLEDPATGSAAANLGGWWLAMGRPLPCRLEIAQGEQIARPSTLYLEVTPQGAIAVGGDVVELGRGSVEL